MSSTSVQYQILVKALKSNWVHLVGIYFCIEAMMIFYGAEHLLDTGNFNLFLFTIIVSAPLLMFTYGLMSLGGFYLVLLLLDILLFTTVKGKTLTIVIIEWLLISPIFIYWAVTYQYWLWLGLVLTFLITQWIRARKIDRYQITYLSN